MRNELGNRIKENYENRYRHSLTRRTPVIIRVDGKAFHTLTRGCAKPFDQNLINSMVASAEQVAREIQGFKLAYVQSDEASFLLTDYDQLDTDAWFDYNLQKMVSVTTAMMTAHFNSHIWALKDHPMKDRMAFFDARAFNIPEDEIANYFLWRAKDWERNSLQMLARAHFSQKELHGKNRAGLHELLHQKGINWADCSLQHKNGTFIDREGYLYPSATYPEISALVEEVLEIRA